MLTAVFFMLFLLAACLAMVFIGLYLSKKKEFEETFERFKDVLDIDKEIKKAEKGFTERQKTYEKYITEYNKKENEIKSNYNQMENQLKSSYTQKRIIYDKLIREINILEEHTEDLSFGFYKPHFDFDTPERYKIELQNIKNKQKEMVRAKTAAICHTDWTVGGSKAEGKKMTTRTIKLILRAFEVLNG